MKPAEGICCAEAAGGVLLPVIDVTHPAFAADFTDEEMAGAAEHSLKHLNGRQPPAFVLRWMARRSVIVRELMRASGGVLGGMATYLQKLGPENSRSWAGVLDRRLLHEIMPMCARIRVREVARALAAELAPMLEASESAGLHLLNIAGGTGIDSLNALIVLRRQWPRALERRRVVIHLLDPDREGPAFGMRALAALRADGAPLAGMDVSMRHADYNWSAPERLVRLAGDIADPAALLACSSEGGLLEYGTDEEVVANLTQLRHLTPAVRVVVASLLHECDITRSVQRAGGMRLVLRNSRSAAALFGAAGWSLRRCIDCGPAYQVVTLTRRE